MPEISDEALAALTKAVEGLTPPPPDTTTPDPPPARQTQNRETQTPEPVIDATKAPPATAEGKSADELAAALQVKERENAALRALHDVKLPEKMTLDDALKEMAVKPDGSLVYVGARAEADAPAPPPKSGAAPSARAKDGGASKPGPATAAASPDLPPAFGDNTSSL